MSAWTEERIAELKRLYLLDGWSASRIAAELGGITRNAVIGKVHRLGIRDPSRQDTARKLHGISERARNKAKAFKAAPIRFATAETPDFTVGTVRPPHTPKASGVSSPCARPWLERDFAECAYPLEGRGEGADTVSCCNKCVLDGPYCPGHRALVYVGGSNAPPPTSARRDTSRSLPAKQSSDDEPQPLDFERAA